MFSATAVDGGDSADAALQAARVWAAHHIGSTISYEYSTDGGRSFTWVPSALLTVDAEGRMCTKMSPTAASVAAAGVESETSAPDTEPGPVPFLAAGSTTTYRHVRIIMSGTCDVPCELDLRRLDEMFSRAALEAKNPPVIATATGSDSGPTPAAAVLQELERSPIGGETAVAERASPRCPTTTFATSSDDDPLHSATSAATATTTPTEVNLNVQHHCASTTAVSSVPAMVLAAALSVPTTAAASISTPSSTTAPSGTAARPRSVTMTTTRLGLRPSRSGGGPEQHMTTMEVVAAPTAAALPESNPQPTAPATAPAAAVTRSGRQRSTSLIAPTPDLVAAALQQNHFQQHSQPPAATTTGEAGPFDWAGWLDATPLVSFKMALTALDGGTGDLGDVEAVTSKYTTAAGNNEFLTGGLYQESLIDKDAFHTPDELAAIAYYTGDGYRHINPKLRHRPDQRVAKMIRLIVEALKKFFPRRFQLVHRGIHFSIAGSRIQSTASGLQFPIAGQPMQDDDGTGSLLRSMYFAPEQHFKLGQRVPLTALCSFSSKADVAMRFATPMKSDEVSILFVVSNLWGVSIHPFSEYPEEREVMPMPLAVFYAISYQVIISSKLLIVNMEHSLEDSARNCLFHPITGAVSMRAVAAAPLVSTRFVRRQCVEDLRQQLIGARGMRKVFALIGGHGTGKSATAMMAIRDAMQMDDNFIPYHAVLRLDGKQSLALSIKQNLRRSYDARSSGGEEGSAAPEEATPLELWSWWVDENLVRSGIVATTPNGNDTSKSAVVVVIENLDHNNGLIIPQLISLWSEAPRRFGTEHFIITSHTLPSEFGKLHGVVNVSVDTLTEDDVLKMLDAVRAPLARCKDDVADFIKLCNEKGGMQAFLVSRLIDDYLTRPTLYGCERVAYTKWAADFRARAGQQCLRGPRSYEATLPALHDRLLRSLSGIDAPLLFGQLVALHALFNTTTLPMYVVESMLLGSSSPTVALPLEGEMSLDEERRLRFSVMLEQLRERGVVEVTVPVSGMKNIEMHEWHWKHVTLFTPPPDSFSAPFSDAAECAVTEHEKRAWLELFLRAPPAMVTEKIASLGVEISLFTATSVGDVVSKLRDVLQFASSAEARGVRSAACSPWRLQMLLSTLLLQRGALTEADQFAADAIKSARTSSELTRAMLLDNHGEVLRTRGDGSRAATLHQSALEIREALLPAPHLEIAGTLSQLANAEKLVGHRAQSLELHRRALDMRRQLLPGDHRDIATSLNDLGNILHSCGDHKEARTKHEEALAMRRRLLPKDHPEIASSLSNLAKVLTSLGESGAARLCHEEAIAIRKLTLPPGHHKLAASMSNLATVLSALGDVKGALKAHEEALDMRVNGGELSQDHPKLVQSRSFIANEKKKMGCPQEALNMHMMALEARRKLGDGKLIAQSLCDAAGALKSLGKLREALLYHNEALDMRRSLQPINELEIAASLNQMGNVLDDLGRSEDALKSHVDALTIRQKHLAADHPDVAASLCSIGNVLEDLGDHEKALACHEAALRMRQAVLQEKHPDIAVSLNNMGKVLHALGRLDEARCAHEKALTIRKEVFGEAHPKTGASMSNLASTLNALGQNDEALELLKKSIEIRRASLGANHPKLASSLSHLGAVLSSAGNYEEALVHLKESLKIRSESLPEGHPKIAASLRDLAAAFRALGRDEEASEVEEQALNLNHSVENGQRHVDLQASISNISFSIGNVSFAVDSFCSPRLGEGVRHPDAFEQTE